MSPINPLTAIFSHDAETDGLYGEPWAIGAVVLTEQGVTESFAAQLDPSVVTDPWVRENIVPVVDLPRTKTREDLLEGFWAFWLEHREDSLCVADFGVPVEAYVFRKCVEFDTPSRMRLGPYPQHELGSALLLAGIDPDTDRRQMAGYPGLVQHNPLHDAIAAGICWQKCQALIGGGS